MAKQMQSSLQSPWLMVDENDFGYLGAAGNGFVHGLAYVRTITMQRGGEMLGVAQSSESSCCKLNWDSMSPGKP